MRGMLLLRATLFGLTLTSVAVLGQTTPTRPGTPPAPTSTTPPAPTTPAVSPTAVAVTVNGEPIYEVAVLRALERVPPARRAEERPRLINYLVDNLLIDQSLRNAGYKVETTEVDKRVNDMKGELKKVGKDFSKMLGELKVNETELRHHISADLRWFKYASAQATDASLKQLFATNKDMFDGSAVKARHILISMAGKDEKTAPTVIATLQQIKKTIEAEVASGMAKQPATADKIAQEKARTTLLVDSFSKYAKAKSDCPTKANGGEIGWFQKAGFIVAPFSNAAFALQPYQLSDVVKTPFGYHLILVTERKPGRDVKFEEVKEIVKEVYFDRLHDGLAVQLRQKANITVNPTPR